MHYSTVARGSHEVCITYVPFRSQKAPPSNPNPSGGTQHVFLPVTFNQLGVNSTKHCFAGYNVPAGLRMYAHTTQPTDRHGE